MVLCYIPLCNSCIKEKLTLTDELIPQAQMATDRQQDRQMDRWTHRQRSKRGGGSYSQIQIWMWVCVCNSIRMLFKTAFSCFYGKLLYSCIISYLPFAAFLFHYMLCVHLYIYILTSCPACCHAQHCIRTFAIWNTWKDANSVRSLDVWKCKKPLSRWTEWFRWWV